MNLTRHLSFFAPFEATKKTIHENNLTGSLMLTAFGEKYRNDCKQEEERDWTHSERQ